MIQRDTMLKGWLRASHVALIGMLLMSTACSRSLQGHATSRSSDGLMNRSDSAGPIPTLSHRVPADRITAEHLTGEHRIAGEPLSSPPTGTVANGVLGTARRQREEPEEMDSMGGENTSSRSLAAQQHEKERAEGAAAAAAAGLHDVFFGYDSSLISDAASHTLLHDAAWLKAHPEHTLIIEGHCDARGTLEYNLVLGEKRAKNVRAFLIDQQISPQRLTIVSYGKERPFCRTHDEPCYQENRRGHLRLRRGASG